MDDQQGDKSQEATPHRRQKAREQGQVARSQDLSSAALLLGGLLAVLWLGQGLVALFFDLTLEQLGQNAWLETDVATVSNYGVGVIVAFAGVFLPLMGVFLLLAVMSNLLQVGFLFLPEKLAFNPSHINPLKGVKRIFSLPGVVRLGFGIIKICIVAVVAGISLYSQQEEILALSAMSIPQIAWFFPQILLWTAIKIAIALLILAILDFAFQKWKHEQDLKMTNQEVREEMKNLQGDPQIIARRRAVQRQLVLNRLSTAVPKADVVITNPTELAIAIQYDTETMLAPVVVAKGAGIVAQRIRLLALEHNIPVVEKKPLAQALYKQVDVNHPIPRDLYAAVAEVLAYVYQLKGKKIPNPPGSKNAA